MDFSNLFKKQKKGTTPESGEPKPEATETAVPIIAPGTIISIMDTDSQKLGEGVIQRTSERNTVAVTRKTGELALPSIPAETEIKAYGCSHNTPFCLTGIVRSSTKTDLLIGDVEIEERQNQRSNFRVPMNEDAEITITGDKVISINCKIEDLSTTGARISCKEQLKPGDVIHIKALLSSHERKWRLDTDAEVLREQKLETKYGKTCFTYGILFPQFNDKELSKFTWWLNMYQTSLRKQKR